MDEENFLRDNLASISCNETEYVNEPYVTGGNPILADGDLLFNNLLDHSRGGFGKSENLAKIQESDRDFSPAAGGHQCAD